ncbi:hypothetical protein [Sphingomonas sp. 8AM]|uniref:hypothetical protein n=1 Tax=Sphingomonas sp. 8AM TaxID=2653170 RepID=UPI0012F3BB9D|nr:hypothetical protein [Sphingomonas sp. 8AM]VXC61041.1 conserved hypothetical protein [Sphingomonas sp. 8AM]
MTALWFFFQSVVAGPLLDKPAVADPCRAPTGNDVVVCGRRPDPDRYRLRPLTDRYDPDAPAFPKAETGIIGGRAALVAEAEAATVGGVQSNRAMIRLKIPLGKSRR